MVFSMSIKEPYLPRYLLPADVIVGIVNAHFNSIEGRCGLTNLRF